MSGSTVGGVVGGVIGFWIGGPTGAQIGFALGSAAGAYLDPQHIQGPSLGDIPVQTSQEGAPRPIVYGSPQPFPGNIIMAGPKVRFIVEQEQGKGGGPVVEEEHVQQSYAVRICEGEATVITVWRDGKVVLDRSGLLALDPESASFQTKATFYTGDETQLPNATLEALPAANGGGVGNVNAHRGTAYMVVANDDLTSTGGRIPNYEFRMASSATIATPEGSRFWAITTDDSLGSTDWIGTSPNGTDWTTNSLDAPANDQRFMIWGNGVLLRHDQGSGVISYDRGETWSPAPDAISQQKGAYIGNRFWLARYSGVSGDVGSSEDGLVWTAVSTGLAQALTCIGGKSSLLVAGGNAGDITYSTDFGDTWTDVSVGNAEESTCISIGDGQPLVLQGRADGKIYYSGDGATWTLATVPVSFGTSSVISIVYDATAQLYVAAVNNGAIAYSSSGTGFSAAATSNTNPTRRLSSSNGLFVGVFGNSTTRVILTSTDGSNWTSQPHNFTQHILFDVAAMPCAGIELPDAPGYYVDYDGVICGQVRDVATPGTVFLSDIELDIADRCGLDASSMDVSEITAIEVQGFLVGKQMPGTEALRPLMNAYFHDMPEYDLQIHAVRRGQAAVASLVDDDFVESGEDEEIRAQPIELPRKLNLFFSDPAANYAVVPVPAERVSNNIPSTSVISMQLPLVFDRNIASQKADIWLKVIWEEAQGTLKRELPAFKYADLVTSDCITFDSKRWRIYKLEQLEGSIKIEAKRDRISNYASTSTANTPVDPSDPVSDLKGPTILRVLNLPSLRTQDNQPGVYAAVTGLLPGWMGADLYLSLDGGATEQKVATLLNRATMGYLVDDITSTQDDSSGPIVVRLFDNRTMNTVTAAQLAARQNGFAMTTAGVSEVAQVETVTENSSGYFELTNVLRGQLNTTAAAHNALDDFLLLDGAVVLIPIDPVYSGETLIFRAVTRGTAVQNNDTVSIVYDPPIFIRDGGVVTP